MIAQEARAFAAAVQFLTRAPAPLAVDADDYTRSARYFPLVGALVGLFAAAVLVGSAAFAPQPIPIVLALAATAIATGALHEDGLSDWADAMFLVADPARRLEIMKDSRIGVFGALALIFAVALKAAALGALDPIVAALALISAHAGGRAAAVVALIALPYAGGPAAKVTQPSVSFRDVAFAFATVVAVAAVTLPVAAWLTGALIGAICAASAGLISRRRIGGQTGDVLGAIEQLFEIGFLVGAACVIAGPG